MRIWMLWMWVVGLGWDAWAQPALSWQRVYGGGGVDQARAVFATSTGGLAIFGTSSSETNAVKQGPRWGFTDFWMLVVDASGEPIWDRTFGGSGSEELWSVAQTEDGGFLLGGISTSSPSGTKTAASFGGSDFWVARVTAAGEPVWDRAFGGLDVDRLEHIEPLADGGFLVCGSSSSGIDGNKTTPSLGGDDGWILRLNGDGEILWQRTFGGEWTDRILVARELTDGGFLLAGTSDSPISETKTGTHWGFDDFWVIRIDAAGEPVWDRTYGGTRWDYVDDLLLLPDGGALVIGTSLSGENGNKRSPSRGGGVVADGWVVRIDADGEWVWDQSLGGSAVDRLHRGWPTADGGFLLVGHSDSSPSGNKTSPALGWDDLWWVRLDGEGNLLWETVVGSGGSEWASAVAPWPGRGWVAVGRSLPINDQAPPVPHYGGEDFFVVALPDDLPSLRLERPTAPAGGATATLTGAPGVWYRVESSAHLTAWEEVWTERLTGTETNWNAMLNQDQGFFRVRVAPRPATP